MSTPERPSPYPQRPLEPGQWVLVMLPPSSQHHGDIGPVEYGRDSGEYRVDGLPFDLNRDKLWEFEWEWSGT